MKELERWDVKGKVLRLFPDDVGIIDWERGEMVVETEAREPDANPDGQHFRIATRKPLPEALKKNTLVDTVTGEEIDHVNSYHVYSGIIVRHAKKDGVAFVHDGRIALVVEIRKHQLGILDNTSR